MWSYIILKYRLFKNVIWLTSDNPLIKFGHKFIYSPISFSKVCIIHQLPPQVDSLYVDDYSDTNRFSHIIKLLRVIQNETNHITASSPGLEDSTRSSSRVTHIDLGMVPIFSFVTCSCNMIFKIHFRWFFSWARYVGSVKR